MASKPRQRYTPEFKAQILELLATGKPVSQVAREFGLGENLLYNWRLAAHGPQGSDSSRAVAAATANNDPAAALRALQREIVLLRQENDILKKAAVLLGTRPQPGSGT
jgi:transposase